ncbi:MAG TPA: RDD family protein, partial [Pyrinomonadaceae bacterium]|nr:RDD family protein [Pyrinomonadaceae bacterium]
MTDNPNATPQTTQSAPNSTLLEFPGVNRRPAWRKELSERFREIQQRRAREAALDAGEIYVDEPRQVEPEATASPAAATKTSETSKQLGLVPPPPDEPEMNPIVAAALARIERARTQSGGMSAPRTSSGRAQAATATARVIAEQPEQFEEADPAPAHSKRKSGRANKPEAGVEAARASTLVVVPQKQSAKSEPPAVETASAAPAPETKTTVTTTTVATETIETPPAVQSTAQPAVVQSQTGAKPQPRHIAGVIDEFWLERQGIELLPKVAAPDVSDDRAPRTKRLVAGLIDLVAVAFLSAPCAAIIELSIGNWNDPRVSGSMAGIVVVVMFLYNFCSVALAGRTPGMSLCSLHTVDAKTASVPTTGQCIRRALFYIISLATFGLGI